MFGWVWLALELKFLLDLQLRERFLWWTILGGGASQLIILVRKRSHLNIFSYIVKFPPSFGTVSFRNALFLGELVVAWRFDPFYGCGLILWRIIPFAILWSI